jgi:hypothetical protein
LLTPPRITRRSGWQKLFAGSRRRGHYGPAVQTRATYQCLNCALAQRAEVRGPRRRRATQENAQNSMAMLLALKRCPRCGYFDKRVAQHNRRAMVVTEVLVVSLLVAIAGTLLLIPMPRIALVISLGVLAVIAIAQALMVRGHYPVNSEQRVVFTETMKVDNRWFVS